MSLLRVRAATLCTSAHAYANAPSRYRFGYRVARASNGRTNASDVASRVLGQALVSPDPSTPLPSRSSSSSSSSSPAAARPGYLSFKTDGCLIGVSWYKFGSLLGNHVHAAFTSASEGAGGGDGADETGAACVAFALQNIAHAENQGWGHFPVLRSNQTALIGVAMREWAATALLAEKTGDPGAKTLEQVEEKVLPPFLAQCYALLGALPPAPASTADDGGGGGAAGAAGHRDTGGAISMSFEAVCPDRLTLWGSLQEGLAVSYARGRMQFLGMSAGSGTSWPAYICHGEIANLVAGAGLAQPACLAVRTAGDVNSAVDALSRVLRGELTEAAFFSQGDWMANSGGGGGGGGVGGGGGGAHAASASAANQEGSSDLLVDAEGFVLITGDGEYSKVKGVEYYLCHKFQSKKITEVLGLNPVISKYFPLYTQLVRAVEPAEAPELLGQVQRVVTRVAAAVNAGIVAGQSNRARARGP